MLRPILKRQQCRELYKYLEDGMLVRWVQPHLACVFLAVDSDSESILIGSECLVSSRGHFYPDPRLAYRLLAEKIEEHTSGRGLPRAGGPVLNLPHLCNADFSPHGVLPRYWSTKVLTETANRLGRHLIFPSLQCEPSQDELSVFFDVVEAINE